MPSRAQRGVRLATISASRSSHLLLGYPWLLAAIDEWQHPQPHSYEKEVSPDGYFLRYRYSGNSETLFKTATSRAGMNPSLPPIFRIGQRNFLI